MYRSIKESLITYSSVGVSSSFFPKEEMISHTGSPSNTLVSLSNQLSGRFLSKRHPRQHHRSLGGWTPTSSYQTGLKDGQKLNLHKGVSQKTKSRNKRLESF